MKRVHRISCQEVSPSECKQYVCMGGCVPGCGVRMYDLCVEDMWYQIYAFSAQDSGIVLVPV